jgi:hypothetical protein
MGGQLVDGTWGTVSMWCLGTVSRWDFGGQLVGGTSGDS